MKKKAKLDEYEIYKSIRKETPPSTRAIPDKRNILERKQFEEDLGTSLKEEEKSKTDVKVRFAPSPTGFLHIGGARTALYNWLFARNKGGTFVLRVEDTDRARSTEEAIEAILDSLKWMGLNWDQGPYHQMDRLDLYFQAADKLLKAQKAYYCYCLPQEFEERRKKAIAQGKMPHYDRRCLNLSDEELDSYKNSGRKPSIRFLTPDSGNTVVSDLIRGKVVFENSLLDDFIIVRGDKIPTYNFAAVVDDGEMGITHVIRGEDHLSNTPKQVLVYEALGYQLPFFAHLPMILGKDKAPLSKRHGATAAGEFKKEGYLPEALINYLVLLGWSFDDATTLFTIDELIEKFSLEKVSKSAAVFDPEKLDWMNGSYIRNLTVKELTRRCLPYLAEAGFIEEHAQIKDESLLRLEKMIGLAQKRIKKLSEVAQTIEIFFQEEVHYEEAAVEKVLKKEDVSKILGESSKIMNDIEVWNHEVIERDLRTLQKELDLKPRIVFQTIRVATTGQMVSLPLFETLELLGKDEIMKRLEQAQRLIA